AGRAPEATGKAKQLPGGERHALVTPPTLPDPRLEQEAVINAARHPLRWSIPLRGSLAPRFGVAPRPALGTLPPRRGSDSGNVLY
ncbi:MAG TPA: hypothetical protein VL380_05850, partial [Nitrosospira sp.]|nr:hypothetical protein [Nitrosospira sp.]